MENEITCEHIGCENSAAGPAHQWCVACAWEIEEENSRKCDDGTDQWDNFDDSEWENAEEACEPTQFDRFFGDFPNIPTIR